MYALQRVCQPGTEEKVGDAEQIPSPIYVRFATTRQEFAGEQRATLTTTATNHSCQSFPADTQKDGQNGATHHNKLLIIFCLSVCLSIALLHSDRRQTRFQQHLMLKGAKQGTCPNKILCPVYQL